MCGGKLQNPTIVVTNCISVAEFLSVSSVRHPVGIEIDGTNFTLRHILTSNFGTLGSATITNEGQPEFEVVSILVWL